MRAAFALPFLAAAAHAACNSYNPDLGAVPFRCGTDEPRCPLGYTCVSYSGDEELCEKTGNEGDDGADAGSQPDGGGGFTCADDGELEPNNNMGEATNTLIPSQHDTYKLVSLSICPDTDLDIFRFEVDVSGKNLRADLSYQATRGQLILEVLEDGGTVPPSRTFSDKQQSLEGKGERFEKFAHISLGVGAAAAVGAGVRRFLEVRDARKRRRAREESGPDNDEPKLSATPLVGEDFIGGAAAVRF